LTRFPLALNAKARLLARSTYRAAAMIDLYYWPTPNGWKIAIALEEMNLPYSTHLVNIGKGDQFKPDFFEHIAQ
jgi:hypothetical protein